MNNDHQLRKLINTIILIIVLENNGCSLELHCAHKHNDK